MVELEWHTLLHCSIDLDIDVVTKPVGPQVRGEGDVTLLPEATRKEISRPRAKTMALHGCCACKLPNLEQTVHFC